MKCFGLQRSIRFDEPPWFSVDCLLGSSILSYLTSAAKELSTYLRFNGLYYRRRCHINVYLSQYQRTRFPEYSYYPLVR